MSLGRWLLVVAALAGVPLAIARFAVVRLGPAEYGVRQNQWTGELESSDRGVGLHLVLPGVHRLHRLPGRAQLLVIGGANRPPLELRTRDDNLARATVVLLWRVRPGRAHAIVAQGAESTYAERLVGAVEEVLRGEFASLSSEDWFDPATRATRLAAARPRLDAALAALELELLDVFPPHVAFSAEYEARLQTGQAAAQRRQLEIARDDVADANDALALAEEVTRAAEKERVAEWQRERSALVLAAERERAGVAAATLAEVAALERDAEARWHALVGTAEDALARAKADVDALRLGALATSGGRVLLARRAAESLRLTAVELDARDARVPLALDLDALVSLLLGAHP